MAATVLWALAALFAFRLVWRGTQPLPDAHGPPVNPDAAMAWRWPVLDAELWSVFRSGEPVAPPPSTGALSSRFRLAGVFLILSETERAGGENRCAILDDLQDKKQFLVVEEEWIDSVRVVRVESDHVVLKSGDQEEMLSLAAGILADQDGTPVAGLPGEATPTILETNRFGKRVGETRWEFNRQSVLDYYQEMMDNPERLASLFLAMRADRDEEGRVAGYRLDMEGGESEFYGQVGFQNGDIIRKVNSMRMTSQRRAEYFIGEFVQNRLGAVVIDIERDGQEKKLIYLVQ